MSQISFVFSDQKEQKKAKILEEYYKQVQETEKYWERDNKMALRVQSHFKMWKLNKQYQNKRYALIIIQRNIRKFLASVQFMRLKELDINRKNVAYFSKQAAIIQRHFRGFHKRKYVHDFYARKQFLTLLKQKNEKFQQDLQLQADQEKIEEERRQEAIARSEFNSLAKNLHHLSSTHQVPGVYNPPYAHTKPTAFNIDVEMHLKATFKANYKWKPPSKEEIQKHTIRPTRPGTLKPINRPNSSKIQQQLNTNNNNTMGGNNTRQGSIGSATLHNTQKSLTQKSFKQATAVQ